MDGEHLNYHHEHCLLGTLATGESVPLTHADRRRHLYLIGKTGTGKSTLLFNMMMADLELGRGFALLDPHGETWRRPSPTPSRPRAASRRSRSALSRMYSSRGPQLSPHRCLKAATMCAATCA